MDKKNKKITDFEEITKDTQYKDFRDAITKLMEAGRALNEAYYKYSFDKKDYSDLWEMVKVAEAIGGQIGEKFFIIEDSE